MIKSISIIVPAYKQEKTIVSDIRHLHLALSKLPYKFEIIVVIDGILDKSSQKLKRAKIRNTKIIEYTRNRGKGYAVKSGMLEGQGDVVGFIDSGRDIDTSALSIALNLMEFHNADIVMGSKLHPDSLVNYPLNRKIISLIYRTITRILFDFEVKDTQVGLKIFRKKTAHDVFSRIIVKAFAFDVEVLAVARLLGYKKIYEAPIKLRFRQGSITSVSFLKIAILTFWDTIAIFYRIHILRYYKK